MSLEGIDDIHGSDGLSLGVISVSDGVTNDRLEEDVQDSAGLLIDSIADTLDTTTASETTNSGLSDTLQIVAGNLAMTLSTSLTGSLTTFTTSSHVD